LGQHNLTPLDLIVAETSRGLAMWTNNRRIAGDRNRFEGDTMWSAV
jgi:hypothetical protein